MRLLVLSSGSHGNCYLLESDGEILILDCGIPMKNIKIGLDFDLPKIVGALVTHQHLDHSKSAEDLKKYGITVWQPYLDEQTFQKKQFGRFGVQIFELTTLSEEWTHTNADGSQCPCYGFLISHPDMGKMLYITDTELIKWRFNGINHILLGVNYDKELVDRDNSVKANHVFRGHLSIDTACEFVKTNNKNLETVIMCHLSNENSDPAKFKEKMRDVTDADVYVARAGLEIELKKKGECQF